MTLMAKSLDHPDETLTMPGGNGSGAVVAVGDVTVVRGELQPGWRWANDLRAFAGTTSCQVPHTGLILDGTLHFEMDDGTARDVVAGDVYVVPAGHDAWVVGDVPVRSIDWSSTNVDLTKVIRNAQDVAR